MLVFIKFCAAFRQDCMMGLAAKIWEPRSKLLSGKRRIPLRTRFIAQVPYQTPDQFFIWQAIELRRYFYEHGQRRLHFIAPGVVVLIYPCSKLAAPSKPVE